MAQQNVNIKSATTKPTAASAQLTAEQVYDLYRFVMTNGRDTGLDLPELPEGAAEHSFSEEGSPDSYSVWLFEGKPVAASDNLSMINKVIDR